ncbi:MAG TPA: sigma-70 family RNA polymerase sigma factor [Candidatus Saccharimonadales bacterium]|nr:sigma-70 family RNA polymerase sigma factor [Candidatus Saccharimonadales bacterium]
MVKQVGRCEMRHVERMLIQRRSRPNDATITTELISLAARLFRVFAEDRDERVRDLLVEIHHPLALYFTQQFRSRGVEDEDLEQVASLALVKAVNRFDPSRGLEFSTFAKPTITGELKRHFRDKGWAVKVPRALQELAQRLNREATVLAFELGREPTVSELALRLGVDEQNARKALQAGAAYKNSSLDTPSFDDAETTDSDSLTVDQSHLFESIEIRSQLGPLLDRLPKRDQKILFLRFEADMTQAKIAEEFGLSQMYISRLILRSLEKLKRAMLEGSARQCY